VAKVKTPIGQRVDYQLGHDDVRRFNEMRAKNQQAVLPGQRAILIIEADHGGDNVSGYVAYEGDRIAVERVNRGFNPGQWDWRAE
jgi:hypothetical protein